MTENDEARTTDRLRPQPETRFAGVARAFDLGAALAALRAEAHESQDGHRQITLFHRPPVAHVLFAFDPGGALKEHAANGLVAIHVLEGRMKVRADGMEHDLPAGQVLILNPGVLHDVRAAEGGAMLLTVHMEGQ
jgi:quercetin dioxygenase-like cupin family protein